MITRVVITNIQSFTRCLSIEKRFIGFVFIGLKKNELENYKLYEEGKTIGFCDLWIWLKR